MTEPLRGTKEVVLAAVKEDGHALRHASDELKSDREFMKEFKPKGLPRENGISDVCAGNKNTFFRSQGEFYGLGSNEVGQICNSDQPDTKNGRALHLSFQ